MIKKLNVKMTTNYNDDIFEVLSALDDKGLLKNTIITIINKDDKEMTLNINTNESEVDE